MLFLLQEVAQMTPGYTSGNCEIGGLVSALNTLTWWCTFQLRPGHNFAVVNFACQSKAGQSDLKARWQGPQLWSEWGSRYSQSLAVQDSMHLFGTRWIVVNCRMLEVGNMFMRNPNVNIGVERCIQWKGVIGFVETWVDQRIWGSSTFIRFKDDVRDEGFFELYRRQRQTSACVHTKQCVDLWEYYASYRLCWMCDAMHAISYRSLRRYVDNNAVTTFILVEISIFNLAVRNAACIVWVRTEWNITTLCRVAIYNVHWSIFNISAEALSLTQIPKVGNKSETFWSSEG